MTEAMWMDEIDTVCDAYTSRQIDEPEARARLQRLYITGDPSDPDIDEMLDALREDRACDGES